MPQKPQPLFAWRYLKAPLTQHYFVFQQNVGTGNNDYSFQQNFWDDVDIDTRDFFNPQVQQQPTPQVQQQQQQQGDASQNGINFYQLNNQAWESIGGCNRGTCTHQILIWTPLGTSCGFWEIWVVFFPHWN